MFLQRFPDFLVAGCLKDLRWWPRWREKIEAMSTITGTVLTCVRFCGIRTAAEVSLERGVAGIKSDVRRGYSLVTLLDM